MVEVQVSVIIPVLNGAWCIGQQLAALAQQNTERVFEVVVCDNGSVDATRRVCEMWESSVPGLRIVDASDKRSASHARNVGISSAQGEVLLFCDADDVVAHDWVEVMAAHVRPGRMVQGWNDLSLLNGVDTYLGSGMSDTPIMRCGFKPGIETCNFGIAASDARQAGGFDESYAYAEDVDFGWRLQVAGVELVSAPGLVYYRLRGSALDLLRQHRRWSVSSIMLRRRWEGVIPPSYSLKFSLVEIVRQTARLLPRLLATKGFARREVCRSYGTAVGEVEGLLRFKVFGRPRGPELFEFAVGKDQR